MFKPGHYDILYSKDYLTKCPQLGSYDKEFQAVFNPGSGKQAPYPPPVGPHNYNAGNNFNPPAYDKPAFGPSLYPGGDFNPPSYSGPSYNPPVNSGYPQGSTYPSTNFNANPYANISFEPPKANFNEPQYPRPDLGPPAYPNNFGSSDGYKAPERPGFFQPPAYPNIDFNSPSYQNSYPPPAYPKPEPRPSYNPPGYSVPSNNYPPAYGQPNFAYPAFEDMGGHGNNFNGANIPRPKEPYGAPSIATAPESKNENYCLLCAELILGTDMLVLGCLHKFHHHCLKTNATAGCLVPGCGHKITVQERAAISSKVIQCSMAQCKICRNIIADIKKDAAIHCIKMTSKIHKDCFISDIEGQTNGLVVLTKSETTKFKVTCSNCGGEVNEEAVRKNLLPEKYKIYKTERDQREKEERKKAEEEKRAKIKPKCCNMELNKNEFITALEAQEIQNLLVMSCKFICNL